MNSYEAKIAARKERLEARADRLQKEASSVYNRARQMGEAIPFGQPVIGIRDRNYREKMRNTYGRAFRLEKEADNAAAKASSVGTGGISSDDPDAIEKLTKQLEEAAANQDAMKAANAAWRKAGNKQGRQTDGSWIDPPYPAYCLSNNSQNMGRIKGRIEQLKRNAARESKETEGPAGIKIVENAEANRLQIIFPGVPSPAIRAALKSSGFRWAPSDGAWQRQLSNGARWAAECVLKAVTAEN